MTAKEIVYEIIKTNDEFATIKFNTLTNKIEINENNILLVDYDDIYEACKDQYPDTKFTKQLVKDIVIKYARENKYTPEKEIIITKPKSDWYDKLEFDDKDQPRKTLNNVICLFKNYPLFKDKFYYNDFTQYEEYNDDLIRDFHISKFRSICERELGYETKDKVECAVQYVTHENTFNPYKDKIDNLLWDGIERADTFFIDFIGVYDTKLNRSMTKKWLYAMMKRLYEPGCPFDNMLIVYDAQQGTGKSKIIERLVYSLGVNYGYNTSITCDNRDKDNVDKLNKTWVVGIDEMNEFLKKNPEQTKQFLAQSTDQARLSYAKRSEIYKRHCVFYGNSNLEFFLKDYTSSFERRYWIMEANGKVHDKQWWDENLTDEYCQQVLAEMKYFYDNNPNFNYTTLDVEEVEELKEIQYRHKTLNNDVLLKHKILEVLNKNYTKSEFISYNEFAIEANDSTIIAIDKETNQFFSSNTNENTCKLVCIPVNYVKMYVEEYLKRSISTQYITALISVEWSYKKCKYLGDSTNCYRRRFQKVPI